MVLDAFSNRDLLAWFEPHERADCSWCGEHACVSLANSAAQFCLACGAVTINGIRIDAERRIAV